MNRRRAGFATLAVVAVGAPLWGPPLLRQSRFFGVRRVAVEGARYLAVDAVIAALELRPEANVFDDLGELESRVVRVGGVADVTVGRRLPGTLLVRIREIEPLALAEGPEGLVPIGRNGRPLPFDASVAPVDAPLVERADGRVLDALAVIQASDAGLYEAIAAARLAGGDVVLEVNGGRIRLDLPVDPAAVRRVAAVRRDLGERNQAWRELDGRFGIWVVVRKRTDA